VCFSLYFMTFSLSESVTNVRDGFVTHSPFSPIPVLAHVPAVMLCDGFP
jgi:hypothetical protein